MRVQFALVLSLLFFGGCAGKPSAPPPPATTYVSAKGEQLQAAPTRADGTLDAERLAEAKRAGYSLVNTNGQVLYCRTDVKLGTHIHKSSDTVCMTAQEMDTLHELTRHTIERMMPSHTCGPPLAC
jgi:hypothetical protein